MGQPAATRSAGVAGPTEPDDCRTESRDRARGGKVSSSAALDDASRCRFSHRTGLRTDHRGCGPLSVREAGGELSRSSAAGEILAEIGDGWDTSPSKAVRYCASSWWKRRKSQLAACQNGVASITTSCCAEGGRPPKSRWREDWRCGCTG